DIFIERGNGAALGVFNDIAIVHLDDVWGIAASGFSGELWPIIAPAQEAGVNFGAIGGLEQVVDAIGAVGTGLTTPEELAQASALREGRAQAHSARSSERRGAQKKLTSVETKCHIYPPKSANPIRDWTGDQQSPHR